MAGARGSVVAVVAVLALASCLSSEATDVLSHRALLSISSAEANVDAEGAGGTAVELGAAFASKSVGNDQAAETSASAASGAAAEAETAEADSESLAFADDPPQSPQADASAQGIGQATGSHLAGSFASADARRIAELGIEALSVSGSAGGTAGGDHAMTDARILGRTTTARRAECCGGDGLTPIAIVTSEASTIGEVVGGGSNSAVDGQGDAHSVSDARGSVASLLEVAAVRGSGDTGIPFDALAIASSATSGQVETYGTGEISDSQADLDQVMSTQASLVSIEYDPRGFIISRGEARGFGKANAEASMRGMSAQIDGTSGVFLGGDTGGTVVGTSSTNTFISEDEEQASSGSLTRLLVGPPVLAATTGYAGPGYAQTIGSGETMSRLHVLSEGSASTTMENFAGRNVGVANLVNVANGETVIETNTQGVDSGSIGAASSFVESRGTFGESFGGGLTAFGSFNFEPLTAGTAAASAATGDSVITFDSASGASSLNEGSAINESGFVQATVIQESTGLLSGTAEATEAQALELGLQSNSFTDTFFVASDTDGTATAEGMTLEMLMATGAVDFLSMLTSRTSTQIDYLDVPTSRTSIEFLP